MTVQVLDKAHATTALARKLDKVIDLSSSDRDVLDLLGWNSRRVARHRDIISEGDNPASVLLILEGWACRYKMLPGGRRQITAILLPGDFCDLHVTLLSTMDHSIAALTNVRVAAVSRGQLDRAVADRSNLAVGLDWMTMVDLGTLRAWMSSLGQTSALSRVAHLVCELHARTTAIGLADGDSLPFPLTQIDMADATGQTPVHLNRVVGELRRNGWLTFDHQVAIIHDLPALRRAAAFDPSYLHAQAVAAR